MCLIRKITKFAIIFSVLCLPIQPTSALTAADTTDATYIENHGHSKEMSRIVNMQKDQIAGKERKSNRFARWLRRAAQYMDPAFDDGQFGERKVDFYR